MTEVSFKEWSFVEKGFDQEHWYVKLTGGRYHGVVFKYEHIRLNETTESIDYDYEVVDYMDDDPHGEDEFNNATGLILRSILDDAMEQQDFVVGAKE
jgi:hypothetical protein